MRTLISTILVAVFVSIEMMSVSGYVPEYSTNGNGSLCKQSSPMNVAYYNGADSVESQDVPLAAETWNDVPAVIHLTQVGTPGSAAIIVNSTQITNAPSSGTTYNNGDYFHPQIYCSNGLIKTPVVITLGDSQYNTFFQQNPSLNHDDVIINSIAHEMGHALGLGHSLVRCSLMWPGPENMLDSSCLGGVYFPVSDDVDGANALYGRSAPMYFSNDIRFGGHVCYVCVPFATFQDANPPISIPFSMYTLPTWGYHVDVYNSGTLPASGLAVMFAHVTATSLYRFGVGWWQGTPLNMQGVPNNIFASVELDNDGIKLVTNQKTQWSVKVMNCFGCTNFTPVVNHDYLLELVVDNLSPYVRDHAYVFDNGNLVGHASDRTWDGNCCTGGVVSAQWGDAQDSQGSVWEDSNSNPYSNYTMGGYWNFQGSVSKTTGDYGAGSLARGTLITMADGTLTPVQELRVGDKMLGYNPVSGKYTLSTVTRITVVHAADMLIISTEGRMPLRVDNATTENLWTLLPVGTALWLPVTQLRPGDFLLTQQGWKAVTRIQMVSGGNYLMYDISATAPYFANGYLDPPIPS